MFFSLVIISLLLVTSACLLISKSYSLYTRTEHQILTFGYTSLGIPYSLTEDLSESIPYLNSWPSAKYITVWPPSPTSWLCPGSHHLHPNTSPRLFGHSTYLTTALVKYPELLPTNGHFRLSLTLVVGFRSHCYTFRTPYPDPARTLQSLLKTLLLLFLWEIRILTDN